MGITHGQRERRRQYLGGSDIPAILGEYPDGWRTPWDIWAEKTQDLEEDEAGQKEAVAIGQYQEDGLIRWAADQLEVEVNRNRFVVGANKVQAAHLDAVVVPKGGRKLDPDRPWIIEAKTTSMSEGWGEPMTAEVPPWVTCQVQHQMYCSGAVVAYVPVLMPVYQHMRMRLYEVPADPQFQEMISGYARQWWDRHVKGGVEPPDLPTRSYLNRVHRNTSAMKTEDPQVLEAFRQWREHRKARLEYEKAEKMYALRVASQMGKLQAGGMKFFEVMRIAGEKELEVTFKKYSRTTYGRGDKYSDHCESCGIGSKTSDHRRLNTRKQKS